MDTSKQMTLTPAQWRASCARRTNERLVARRVDQQLEQTDWVIELANSAPAHIV